KEAVGDAPGLHRALARGLHDAGEPAGEQDAAARRDLAAHLLRFAQRLGWDRIARILRALPDDGDEGRARHGGRILQGWRRSFLSTGCATTKRSWAISPTSSRRPTTSSPPPCRTSSTRRVRTTSCGSS